jgi:hypothetical protein
MQAKPAVLSPGDHKMVSVAIVGVTDPDNDWVTLTVAGVTQDEPVNSVEDGDTSPDAVLQGTKSCCGGSARALAMAGSTG